MHKKTNRIREGEVLGSVQCKSNPCDLLDVPIKMIDIFLFAYIIESQLKMRTKNKNNKNVASKKTIM